MGAKIIAVIDSSGGAYNSDGMDPVALIEFKEDMMGQAFNNVYQMHVDKKVSMREAAYMVAVSRLYKAMGLRGWL